MTIRPVCSRPVPRPSPASQADTHLKHVSWILKVLRELQIPASGSHGRVLEDGCTGAKSPCHWQGATILRPPKRGQPFQAAALQGQRTAGEDWLRKVRPAESAQADELGTKKGTPKVVVPAPPNKQRKAFYQLHGLLAIRSSFPPSTGF